MKKFPVLLQVKNRKTDDVYYLCHTAVQLHEVALKEFHTLLEMNLLWEPEEPKEDMYGEVTDEMIKNAQSNMVRDALIETKMLRDEWLSREWWNLKSYVGQKRMYSMFQDAKTNGAIAYEYLIETGHAHKIQFYNMSEQDFK